MSVSGSMRVGGAHPEPLLGEPLRRTPALYGRRAPAPELAGMPCFAQSARSPARASPAKNTPGTSRSPTTASGPAGGWRRNLRSRGRQVAATDAVKPRRRRSTSSASIASSAAPSVAAGAPAGRRLGAARSTRSRHEHRNATAEHVVLERLDVARPDADQRPGIDRQRGRRGEQSTIWRAHGSRPVASSKPEFCLPDEDPLVRHTASPGRTSAVVMGELDARRVRGVCGTPPRPRRGRGCDSGTRRRSSRRSKVGTPGVLSTRVPVQRAAVADRDLGPLVERRQVRLHLGSRREVGRCRP
jgi:hypothetical protein